jgi:signal transduction histidine kinase
MSADPLSTLDEPKPGPLANAFDVANPDPEFLIAVIDAIPARLTIIDDNGVVTAANGAWRDRAAVLGKPDDYPVGAHLTELLADIPQRHARALELGFQAVLDGTRDEFSCTYPIGHAGDADWFKQTVSRLSVEGPVQRIVVVQSVQELKRSEQRLKSANTSLRRATIEARDANQAKSIFLATMGHELRTPLNGVLGMAEVMDRHELPDAQRQRLQVIRQSGESLMVLVNDLLELSSIGSSMISLQDGVIDVLQLGNSAERVFRPMAAEKGLSLSVIAHASTRFSKGDPLRLKQVLYKLVSNAVKFTENGSVTIALSHDNERLVLQVADTGIGIPNDKLQDIFRSFTQVDSSATRRFGGAGVGLTICNDLVSLMGGLITVESTEGRGSTFTVSIPVVRAEDGPNLASDSGGYPVQRDGGGLRVLVAEDNPTNQLVLTTLLAEVGIEPVVVADGRQAFDAWSEGTWDLVLMDIHMPVMDGVAAARMIRDTEQRRNLPRTPILAVTADAIGQRQAEYRSAGMDGLVSKPINLGLLLEAMDAALNAEEHVGRQARG